MKLAQQEIKATVTVNTSDLGSKKKDEEPPDKDTPANKKGGARAWIQQKILDHILSSWREFFKGLNSHRHCQG